MTLTMSELIHPTAVIAPEAEIAADVVVGPYSIIEGYVRIGSGCVIEGHACLSGPLLMGMNNHVGHGAVLGKGPQHRLDHGENTELRIGENNVFREHVTVHRGTIQGGGLTLVGNNNYLMIGSHLGHDSKMGNGCTLVNGALMAGHVQLHDGCILSGHSAVQQRVRVGRLAMLGGLGSTTKDIPPFVLQQGYNNVTGLNIVGMRRSGMTSEAINAVREAFRILFKEGRTQGAAVDLIEKDLGHIGEVAEFVNFVRESKTGINPIRGGDRHGGEC